MATRFYFHLVKGQQRIVDRIGTVVLPEIVMSDSVLDVARDIWPGIDDPLAWGGWTIEICDAHGNVVREISLV
jgi:hypothetical protein